MAQILPDIYTAVQECLLFRRLFLRVCVRASHTRYRTPIYRCFIDRVRNLKIYTGETALARVEER